MRVFCKEIRCVVCVQHVPLVMEMLVFTKILQSDVHQVDTYTNVEYFPMCPPMLEFMNSDVGVFLPIQTMGYFNKFKDLLDLFTLGIQD